MTNTANPNKLTSKIFNVSGKYHILTSINLTLFMYTLENNKIFLINSHCPIKSINP